MGAIAQQAQGQQLQPLNPKGKLKQLVEHSWPQIARVIGGNLDSEALLQMCISSINRTPALADCTPVSVLSCFMQCAALGLRPSDVDGLGQAYILPYGNKNYATGEKQATFVIGYKGMLKLLENSGIYAQPRAVYEDDNIKLKLDENGVPTIECPDEVSVDETTPDYSDVFQPVITDSTDDVTAEVMDTEADSEQQADAKDGE